VGALSMLAAVAAPVREVEADARAKPTVRLYVSAAEPVMDALVERLQPRLAAMGVELVASVVASVDLDAVLATAPATSEAAPLAQVWLDGRRSIDATVFLMPRRADRVLARHIPSSAAFDEVALAEVVFVIERAVSSLLASRPIGVPKAELEPSFRRRLEPPPPMEAPVPPPLAIAPPVETPPPAPVAAPSPPTVTEVAPDPAPAAVAIDGAPPPPPASPAAVAPPVASVVASPSPPERASGSFQLGAFAGAESWATGHELVPDVGLVAVLERVRDRARWGASLDGQLHSALDADTADGKVELSGGGAHLLLSYGRSFGGALGRLALGPGLAVSALRATPSTSVASATARNRTDLDWTVAVMLRWDVPVSGSLRAFVAAGADVALATGRYTAVVDGASTTLLTPWPVRPTLRLGLAFGAR
jgi:phosphate/sulfate permease